MFRKWQKLAWLMFVVMMLNGCAAFGQLARAAGGSQWLGTVVEYAAAGAEQYFARHPNQRAQEVAAAGLEVLRAKAAYDEALVSERDPKPEKAALLEAWAAYLALLAELGVLDARVPDGGAQGEGPPPEPLQLPSADQVAARLP
jgi:hypothetical protein